MLAMPQISLMQNANHNVYAQGFSPTRLAITTCSAPEWNFKRPDKPAGFGGGNSLNPVL